MKGGSSPPSPIKNDDHAYHLDQLDGNISICSSISESESEKFVNPIPVHIGYRPAKSYMNAPLKHRGPLEEITKQSKL